MSKFLGALKPNSVAIIVSNPERTRSNDTEYPYRQSSDILYLNGFPEPESALVFHKVSRKETKLVMFVRAKDAAREQWTGIRAGTEGAAAHFFAAEAHTVDKFEEVVGKLIASSDNVYYKFGRNPEFDKRFEKIWAEGQRNLLNPENILHGMRMFKNAAEVRMIEEAARISAEAHIAAAKRCRPGLKEYQLQATMEFIFTDNGAMAPAYTSIVANGPSGWVLHYISNQGGLKRGDMVLIDAACEYQGYAADITRTFPVNGKFTAEQAQVYQLVLDAQEAAINAAKPGATLRDVHETAQKVLSDGLAKLGISEEHIRAFFPHGTSHWLGLDVHDVGTNGTRSDKGKARKLAPGMVFTVEPGLYFAADDTRVPEKYRGIAVRIEDDVLVTEAGNRVLTSLVPKAIADIEAMMRR
jgi:Xaa-Pro aminopeptidase